MRAHEAWTDEMENASIRRGWILRPQDDGLYGIERLDNMDEVRFDSDVEAEWYVFKLASQGSPLEFTAVYLTRRGPDDHISPHDGTSTESLDPPYWEPHEDMLI